MWGARFEGLVSGGLGMFGVDWVLVELGVGEERIGANLGRGCPAALASSVAFSWSSIRW